MLSKPELIVLCKQLANETMDRAVEPATILLHRTLDWEDSRAVLGGPAAAATIKAIGDLKAALEGKGLSLPGWTRRVFFGEPQVDDGADVVDLWTASLVQLVWQAATF